MKRRTGLGLVLTLALAVLTASGCVSGKTFDGAKQSANISGVVWRLESFTGADSRSLTSTDETQATVEFFADGRAALKLAINRGSSSWKLGGWNEIELGVMALTRAASPPDPLRDRFTQDWTSIRKFELADGRLFLSLADIAGRYEFERADPQPK